jgi:hypothetical protein
MGSNSVDVNLLKVIENFCLYSIIVATDIEDYESTFVVRTIEGTFEIGEVFPFGFLRFLNPLGKRLTSVRVFCHEHVDFRSVDYEHRYASSILILIMPLWHNLVKSFRL